MKMKAVEVELLQEKSITEEMKRKVEAEKRANQRKRGREEEEEEEEKKEKKEEKDEEDPFDKIRATASENKLKSPQLSVSVPNGLKVPTLRKSTVSVNFNFILIECNFSSGKIHRGPRFFGYT